MPCLPPAGITLIGALKRRIFTRKVVYRLFQLNVGTFQKCKKCSRMRTPRLSRRLPAARLGYVTEMH